MKWEFFSEEVTDKGYCLEEPGPLYSPVDRFTFSRDKSRRLYLETTSPISSTSQAAPPKTGEVYFNTTSAVFRALDSGACKVTAHGVAKELTTRALAGDIKTTARFRVHSLEWERDDHSARKYTMEWVENMPRSVHWPHRNELVKKGETIRTLSSSQGAVKLVEHVDDSIFMEHCWHVVMKDFEFYIGNASGAPPGLYCPGFILYIGNPDEQIRRKVRDCLSFCLGSFLLYLGETTFDENWLPTSFHAMSGHAHAEHVRHLNGSAPSTLSLNAYDVVDSEYLQKMFSSLLDIYDSHRMRGTFWRYWHAEAAPIDMRAAHYGATIEGLQAAYFKLPGNEAMPKIVDDEKLWAPVRAKLSDCIDASDLSPEQKEITKKNLDALNRASQLLQLDRFAQALNLQLGPVERAAWKHRNSAAHGRSADTPTKSIEVIRGNKALQVFIHRIILAMSGAAPQYIDYYTITTGRVHHVRQLSLPIPSDIPPKAHAGK